MSDWKPRLKKLRLRADEVGLQELLELDLLGEADDDLCLAAANLITVLEGEVERSGFVEAPVEGGLQVFEGRALSLEGVVHICVVGQTGTGKTCFQALLVSEAARKS